MTNKQRDPFKSTFHRDGSVTVWNVYRQGWQRAAAESISDSVLASLSGQERARVQRLRKEANRG